MKKTLKYLLTIIKFKKVMESTQGVLFKLFEERNQVSGSLFGLLLRKQMETFIEDNKATHQAIFEQMIALNKKYFVHEGEKIAMSKPPAFGIVDKNGHRQNHVPKPILNPGFTMYGYEEEFEKIMSAPCEIII